MDGDPNRTALSWARRGGFTFEVVDSRQAMKVIKEASYVVIDTPARPDSDDMKELALGCDLLVLPTKPDIVSLEPTLLTVRDLKQAIYRVLLTLVPPYPSKEGENLRQELLDGGVPVFKNMVRRTVGFEKAAHAGVSIRDLDDSRLKTAWSDYFNVGNEVMEILG